MTSQGNGHHYKITFFGSLTEDLKSIFELAKALGLSSTVKAALEFAVFHIQHDPWQFGEQIQYLPDAQLHIHVRVVNPLVIEYAIHDEKPIVLINRVHLLV